MLELDGLRIVQGDFHLEADFSVNAGSRVAILGPSGGGKSTLLNAIAGFVEPTAGRVKWNDQDISNLAPGDRPLSIIFQDNNLFPHMSVFQNVAVGLQPSMRLADSEKETVVEALNQVGLAGMEHRMPSTLSGGQLGRVALARVLVRRRPLLLLDEPFSALGPALKGEMLELVAELAKASNATLLMVTHDPDDALRIAEQTVLVARGVAHPPEPTQELLANPPEPLQDYLGHRVLK